MKYKTYLEEQFPTVIEQVLHGRGIDDISAWLNANTENIESWRALDNMRLAVCEINSIIENNLDACIVVDCDVDGYTSAAIIINYFYSLYPEWVENHLSYIHHTGKQHGLCDVRESFPENISLIICPDSASNDYEEHKYWNDQQVSIIILDHHEADHVSTAPQTITVNNQLCNYKNKMLSGAGIAWQFCRAYDEIVGVTGNTSIDLCALGNTGDMMSYKSIETKAIIQEGLNNIVNPFFNELLEINKYTLDKYGGPLCYKAIAFAVVPFINATVRSGTPEEKDMVFKAMCKPWCFQKVPNTKRGHKGEEWPLYQQAAYLTTAIKRRQTKLETESMILLEKKINDKCLYNDNIIVCCCEPGEVEPNIRGLAANKLASKYQRPCLVLTKNKTKDDNEYFYRGSARNYSMSTIQDLKAIEESTKIPEYVTGHANAHGISIAEKDIQNFIDIMNEKYKDIPKEATYWVDYIFDMDDADQDILLQLAECASFWGQDIPASQIAIENIDISRCHCRLCGSKNNTLRMVLPNGLVLVQFNITETEYNNLLLPNNDMTCIVTPQKNEWQGNVSGEGIINDSIIFPRKKWVF